MIHRLLILAFAACMASQVSFAANDAAVSSDLTVGVNKSTILQNAAGVKRISITNPDLAEAVAVSKTEVLVNGKAPGDTSLILWDQNDQRTMFDVHIVMPATKLEAVRNEMKQELPGQNVTVTLSEGSVFLHGTVNDGTSADRAAEIASTLGKVVNLLRVQIPEADTQVLLKVRFASVDRTALQQLGANLISTGATNTIGTISTGQFGQQPSFDFTQNPFTIDFNNLLNIFFFRRDINLAGTIQALETKQLLQILAEPNLLTVMGRPASFLAGGEFPYPTLQGGGAGVGQITIQFREFGVRIRFLPTLTPRGTIHLVLTPEVSSLDYTKGLTISGYTIPGLDTRRVQTEIELENGQSFAIAGLIDNRVTENLNKIPGLSNIPVLGKLFESRSLQKTNSELLVLVTPLLVRPIPAGAKPPEVKMPKDFMKGAPTSAPQNPTDRNAKTPRVESLPWETLKNWGEPQPASAPVPTNGTPDQGIKPLFQSTSPGSEPAPGSGPKG